MSEQSAWFQKPIDTTTKPSVMNSATNFPFDMKVDEKVRVAFLNKDDEDIPPFHYHKVVIDGKPKRVGCTAAEHLGGSCHLCDYTKEQPDGEQWKTKLNSEFCYTILDDRFTETDGVRDVPKKRLRLSTVADNKNIKGLRKIAKEDMDREGIHLTWIKTVRDSKVEKPARVGVLKQILDRVDVTQYEEDFLKPFTIDEILVQFVVDEQEISEINKLYPLNTGQVNSSQIKEIE